MKNSLKQNDTISLQPPFRHSRGTGWKAVLPADLYEIRNTVHHPYRSPLILLEDGKPLRKRFASGLGIHYCGAGAYNHLEELYFSTSDNSDPNTNGKNYAVKIEEKASGTPLPKRVHVVLSYNCNLYCRICRDKRYTAYPFMRKDLFQKIGEQLFPTASELRLDSGGELLLNKELPEILRIVSRYDLPFFSSSNGMLMNQKNARLLAESTLHHIQISLDSPVKETLEWIRRGSDFERVISGVKNLVQARKDVGRPFLITFHAAIMRENARQLPDLVRLARELGIEGVTGCHLFVHAITDPDSSCFWNQEEYNEMREKAIEVAREIDSFYYGPAPFTPKQAEIESKNAAYCLYPDHGVYIEPAGDVKACCVSPIYSFGNLDEQSFEEIWNGEKYRKLRETYLSDKPFLPHCKGCLNKNTAGESWQSFFSPEHWDYVKNRLAGHSGSATTELKPENRNN